MSFLLPFSSKTIRKFISNSLIVCLFGCSIQNISTVGVSPKHFKVQTAFMTDSHGIIINTLCGSEKRHYVLLLDNFSPSWLKSSVVKYTPSFKKAENISFKTSTADGLAIQGNVGIYDSLSFETVTFTNVPFYIMPDTVNDNKNDDGVLGIETMSKGIWKIDWKKNQLTFASDLDSFPEIDQCEIFPAVFDQNSINVKIDFGNNNVKSIPIDLGYNGAVILPLSEFNSISKSKRIFSDMGNFSTPGHQNLVNTLSILDTVKINYNYFNTLVCTNESVKERLLGLSFFKKFDFVIFDFINKRIYLPKKVW